MPWKDKNKYRTAEYFVEIEEVLSSSQEEEFAYVADNQYIPSVVETDDFNDQMP